MGRRATSAGMDNGDDNADIDVGSLQEKDTLKHCHMRTSENPLAHALIHRRTQCLTHSLFTDVYHVQTDEHLSRGELSGRNRLFI